MFVTHLSCPRCERRNEAGVPRNVCDCGSPLLVEYDLERVSASMSTESIAARAPTMWRYRELLPVRDPGSIVSLGEGFTPLIPVPRLGRRHGLPQLLAKDEGLNPTGTFKARGASCGVSMARELGISEVALPTAGNAGGAWAAYGAAAGLGVHVAMPSDAPPVQHVESLAYGADVTLVDGLISDAAAATAAGVRERGWFDVSTLREPYRIEGKKTIGLELAEQLGWRMPHAVLCPVGGGVGLIGIWRALGQLRDLGWVNGDPPRLIAVQSEGCAPVVQAFEEGRPDVEAWQGAATIAAGLRVPKPFGGFLVLRAVRESGGTAVAVEDGHIREMAGELARHAGILAAPEGAATLAAASILRERGVLGARDLVVLLNTGTGLKMPELLGDGLERFGQTP